MLNINNGFSNHVHSAIHPDGTVFLAVNENNPATRSKPRNVVIYKVKPGVGQTYETASYQKIHTYQEGVDADDAISASSLVISPNGDLVVYLTRGIMRGRAIQWVLSVDVLHGIANPYTTVTPTPIGGSNVDVEARLLANRALQTANSMVDALNKVQSVASNALNIAKSKPSVDDIWNKSGDRVAFELNTNNSPLNTTIWQKALDAAYTFAKQRGLINE